MVHAKALRRKEAKEGEEESLAGELASRVIGLRTSESVTLQPSEANRQPFIQEELKEGEGKEEE